MSSDDDTPSAEPTSGSKEFETQETAAEPTGSADTLSEDSTAKIEDTDAESPEEESEKFHPRVSRRGMLLTGGVLGLLGLGSGNAAAATGSGQIGTTTTPLKTLFANEINGGVTGDSALKSLVGGDLSIDGSGNLTTGGSSGPFADDDSDNLVEPTGSLTGIDVTDVETDTLNGALTGDTEVTSITGDGLSISSGSLTTSLGQGLQFDDTDAIEPNLGSGLEFDSGTGEIKTADTGSASVSKLTTATSSIDALEVTETGAIDGGTAVDVNVVGGSPDNTSSSESVSNVTMFGKTNSAEADTATISGGESHSVQPASDDVGGGTVGGGKGHTVTSNFSTIGGGDSNTASLNTSTVGGGTDNQITGVVGDSSTIAGGKNNSTDAGPNAIGGGEGNTTSGGFTHITIPGGENNTASSSHATIIGGKGNTVDDTFGIAGGDGNTASGGIALGTQNNAVAGFIDGGENNPDIAIGALNNAKAGSAGGNILIGTENESGGSVSRGNGIAIGANNRALESNTVAIGKDCHAGGTNCVAIGTKGQAFTGESGLLTNSFVFSDGKDANGDDLSDGDYNQAEKTGEARFYTSGGFVIENTNTVQVTQGLPPNGSASSVGIDGSGNLVNIGTSSARYKTNIEPLGTDTSGVLDLQPTAYEYEETGQADTGLIAEEVNEALPEIVNYDDEGRPDAVRYDRVGMFLAPEVSENRDRLETVEAAREECEETIETLEVELDAKDARLADQADRIEHLESTVENKSILLEGVQSVVDEKEARIDELEAENTKLETRLSAVEAELGFGGVTADASVADD